MITIAAIFAASAFGGILAGVTATLLEKYWDKIVNFLKKVITKLKEKLRETLIGCAVFLKKLSNKIYQNRTKHYSKNELGKWKETIVTYEQNEKEVPEKYKNIAVIDEEFDISDDFELVMEKRA